MFTFQSISSAPLAAAAEKKPPLFNYIRVVIQDVATAISTVSDGLLAKYGPGLDFKQGARGILLNKTAAAVGALPVTIESKDGTCRVLNQSASLPFSLTGLDPKGQQYCDEVSLANASDPEKVALLKRVYLDHYSRDHGKPTQVPFSRNLDDVNAALAKKGLSLTLTQENLKTLAGDKFKGMPNHIDVIADNGETYVLERSTRKDGVLNIFKRNNNVPSQEEYDIFLNKSVHMSGYLTAAKLRLVEQEFGLTDGFKISDGVAMVNAQVTLVQISLWDALKEILPEVTKSIDFRAARQERSSDEPDSGAISFLSSRLDKTIAYAQSLTSNKTKKEYDSVTSKGAYDRLRGALEGIFSKYASPALQLAQNSIDGFMSVVIGDAKNRGSIEDSRNTTAFAYDLAKKKKEEKDDQDSKTDGGFA
ncbi:MAG: hypothetical protein WC861_02275 [Candidatus Micrarchaeia archaeon]|jgi:hypothetical protein